VFVQPGAKVDSSYYFDVVLNQGLLPDIQKLSGNNFTFQQDGAPAHRSQQTVAFLCLHVREFVEPENWPPNSPVLNPVDYLIYGSTPTAYWPSSSHSRPSITWKKSCKPAGNRLVKTLSIALYGTLSQAIVAHCCNWWRTHWAPLWLLFLVLHVYYHTYVFSCRNTELGQQK